MAKAKNTQNAGTPNQVTVSSGLGHWVILSAIALATGAAFLPSLQNHFVNWDDYVNLVDNPHYRGLGWTELSWMLTTFYMSHYRPLTWMTLGFDYLVWGLDPFGYHLTNLLFHCANAVLFYLVSLRLLALAYSISAPSESVMLRLASGFAALLFGLHPLRVEAVAWVSARNDLVAGFFFFLTVLCYLRATAEPTMEIGRRRWMGMALMTFVLSLLSKAIGMTLPVILLILDVYPLRRLGGDLGWFGPAARKVWREKIPFILLALAAGVIAVMAKEEAGALKDAERYGPLLRLAQALFGLVFYAWKTIYPLGLSPLYELPVELDPWDWPFILSGLLVASITVGLLALRNRWPAGLILGVYYVIVLTPVLGVAQSGPQIVADRYSYLSCLGWAMMGGAGLIYFWRVRLDRYSRSRALGFAVGAVAVVAVVLGALTWKQTQIWYDSETLWRHALSVTQTSHSVHYNLATVLQDRGNLDEAIEHYRKSLQIYPAADAHYNLGYALEQRNEPSQAVEHYRRAIKINPKYWDAHNNLAILLESRGNIEEAIQ